MASLLDDIFWAKQSCAGHRNYKMISEYKLNFSCPICGDSDVDKKKARCYVYPSKKGILKVKCHNCNYGPEPFSNFLRLTDPIRYKEYIFDVFTRKRETKVEPQLTTTPFEHLRIKKKENPLGLELASSDNEALEYVRSRQIPESKIPQIYMHENYTEWSQEYGRELEFVPSSDKRVVLVCSDADSKIIGTIGRKITPGGLRYNNIKLSGSYQNLVYGLDHINSNTDIRVVEGAFDSLFVDNCIAISSSALASSVQYVNKRKSILIWDNEPRNKEICSNISAAIKAGNRVVIWPKEIIEKDINNMVLAGIKDIDSIIDNNTFSGLEAELKFIDWAKVS